MIRTTRLVGIREVAEARQKREMEEALQRTQQQEPFPETEDIEKWWNAPTLLETPCLVCVELLEEALEEERPQITAVSLDLDEDRTLDRQSILTLIEAGARNHFCKSGTIPGQIKISLTTALMGLPAYFIFENTIIPLREDATLQPNAIQCLSSRAFIL